MSLQLKGKFVAAQNQVQDLLAKLQQMQAKVWKSDVGFSFFPTAEYIK